MVRSLIFTFGTLLLHVEGQVCTTGQANDESCFESLANIGQSTAPLMNQCADVIREAQNTDLVKKLQAAQGQSGTLSQVLQIPDSDYVSFCSFFQTQVRPCFISSFDAWLESLNANPCCANTDLNEVVGRLLGKTLEEIFDFVVDTSVDLLCNKRTPDFGVETEQTCGYTMVQGLGGVASIDDLAEQAKALLEIPHDQTCAAFTGEEYVNTRGLAMSLMVESPLGNCATAFDNIFTFMEEWYEALKNSSDTVAKTLLTLNNGTLEEALSDTFAPGECFDVSDLTDPFSPTGNTSNVTTTTITTTTIGFETGDICVNLPTGFSEDCGFEEVEATAEGAAATLSLLTTWFTIIFVNAVVFS